MKVAPAFTPSTPRHWLSSTGLPWKTRFRLSTMPGLFSRNICLSLPIVSVLLRFSEVLFPVEPLTTFTQRPVVSMGSGLLTTFREVWVVLKNLESYGTGSAGSPFGQFWNISCLPWENIEVEDNKIEQVTKKELKMKQYSHSYPFFYKLLYKLQNYKALQNVHICIFPSNHRRNSSYLQDAFSICIHSIHVLHMFSDLWISFQQRHRGMYQNISMIENTWKAKIKVFTFAKYFVAILMSAFCVVSSVLKFSFNFSLALPLLFH